MSEQELDQIVQNCAERLTDHLRQCWLTREQAISHTVTFIRPACDQFHHASLQRESLLRSALEKLLDTGQSPRIGIDAIVVSLNAFTLARAALAETSVHSGNAANTPPGKPEQ